MADAHKRDSEFKVREGYFGKYRSLLNLKERGVFRKIQEPSYFKVREGYFGKYRSLLRLKERGVFREFNSKVLLSLRLVIDTVSCRIDRQTDIHM